MTLLEFLKSLPADKGMISKKKSKLEGLGHELLGEYFDVFCVANDKKPIAIMDGSRNNLKALRFMHGSSTFDTATDFVRSQNVKCMRVRGAKTYAKYIYFKSEHEDAAHGVAKILGGKYNLQIPLSVALGILLGYSDANIKHYMLQSESTIVNDMKTSRRVILAWVKNS